MTRSSYIRCCDRCNEVSGTYGNGSVKLDAVPST